MADLPKPVEHTLQKPGFTFLPTNWQELFNYAKEIANTDFVPKAMQGKPGAVLAAWQTGQEVGLPPMAALQSIAVINGRPSIYGAGYWALIVGHPLCEWTTETAPDEAVKQGYAEVTIKRKGNPHVFTRRFSVEEAKAAKLWSKDNWQLYPGDMLLWRTRHRCATAAIPEACVGLVPAEIAIEIEPEPKPKTEPFREPKEINGPEVIERSAPPVERADRQSPGPDSLPATDGDEPKKAKKASKPSEFESIAAYLDRADAEFFQNPKNLDEKIKGVELNNQELLEVCRRFNAKKRELNV